MEFLNIQSEMSEIPNNNTKFEIQTDKTQKIDEFDEPINTIGSSIDFILIDLSSATKLDILTTNDNIGFIRVDVNDIVEKTKYDE